MGHTKYFEILTEDFFENENNTIDDVWIWDSYQFDGDWSTFTSSRIGNDDPLGITNKKYMEWVGC